MFMFWKLNESNTVPTQQIQYKNKIFSEFAPQEVTALRHDSQILSQWENEFCKNNGFSWIREFDLAFAHDFFFFLN